MEEAAVVGAGPYGLSVASHLRALGLEPRVFGQVLGFWRSAMPRGMLLRSSKRASSLADPARRSRLEGWERERGRAVAGPVPLEDFLAYADWFRAREVGAIDGTRVERIERVRGGLRLVLQGSEPVEARRVVVATGIGPFAWVPERFRDLPPELASHASAHSDLGRFAGLRVAVVGAGQTALESAALLHESGADVELVVRRPAVAWIQEPSENGSVPRRFAQAVSYSPTDVGPRGVNWIAAVPDAFRRLPPPIRERVTVECLRPMGAYWLRDRLRRVPVAAASTVAAARPIGDALALELGNGERREVDHLLFSTGYRVDVTRYPLLEPLREQLRSAGGYPLLRRGLESSVEGLHFVGAPAVGAFGPVMRFVTGAAYAAPAVARAIAGVAPRPLQVAF